MEYLLEESLREKADWVFQTNSTIKGPRYWRSGAKRSLDVLISTSVSPLALSTMAVCGLAVFMQDGHWPFVEVGNSLVSNRHVPLWKIRTMVLGAQSLEIDVAAGKTLHEVKDKDPRVTPVGRILRRLSFDEAPQVFNVLRGDISAVGPRIPALSDWQNGIYPNRDQEPFNRYINLIDQGLKFGATGLYVVMGRHKLDLEKRIWLEVMYGEQASLVADLRIMALTVLAPLKLTGK